LEGCQCLKRSAVCVKISVLVRAALTAGTGQALVLILQLRLTVISRRSAGHAHTNRIQNGSASYFACRNINKEKIIKVPAPQFDGALINLI
jgi:hypothetical protein